MQYSENQNIKISKTFNQSFIKGLSYLKNLTQDGCTQGYLVYTADQEQSVNGFSTNKLLKSIYYYSQADLSIYSLRLNLTTPQKHPMFKLGACI